MLNLQSNKKVWLIKAKNKNKKKIIKKLTDKSFLICVMCVYVNWQLKPNKHKIFQREFKHNQSKYISLK